MTDHYELFFAGYMHKPEYQLLVECKTSAPIVLRKSTDYAFLCEKALEVLNIAKKNTSMIIR